MEAKSKAKFGEKRQQDNLLKFENQSATTDLIKEMYIHLKKQKIKLSQEQAEWMNKVETLYGKNKIVEADFICSILENTYRYLNRTGKWNEVDDRAYEMLEKIIFLKSKEGAFKEFVDNVEQTIRSTLSLDFSNKAVLCDEKIDERNILNYVTFALNMVIEKIETSMVSMKAINAMLEAPPQSAFIVTDALGQIRFINKIGESLLGIEHNEYLHKPVFPLFIENDNLIKEALESSSFADKKVLLALNDQPIPILLTATHAHKEEDEINEVIFIIKTTEQAEKEKNALALFGTAANDKNKPLDSISEMLHLLKSKSESIDAKHLISFLEESAQIIKKDREQYADHHTSKISENVNIEFIFDRIIEGLKFTEGYNEVSFHKDIFYKHDLYSDPVLIYSILQKLITTAINYRGAKDENKIQFTVRELSDTQLIMILHFNNKDVSLEDLNRLFEKNVRCMFNIDAKQSEQLSVKEAVRKLNGTIDIYNQSGGGIVFSISLPY